MAVNTMQLIRIAILGGPISGLGISKLIASEIVDFVAQNSGSRPIEFWADYGSYDWVVLCQLFGRMIDLPKGWPMYINDLQQHAKFLNYTLPTQGEGLHNALDDARHVLRCYRDCRDICNLIHGIGG